VRELQKASGRLSVRPIMAEAAGSTCLPRSHLNLLMATGVGVQPRQNPAAANRALLALGIPIGAQERTRTFTICTAGT
jgi:hypothetical protein